MIISDHNYKNLSIDTNEAENYLIDLLSVMKNDDVKYNTKYSSISLFLEKDKIVLYKTNYRLLLFGFSRITKSSISKLIIKFYDNKIKESTFRKNLNELLNNRYLSLVKRAYDKYLEHNNDFDLFLLNVIEFEDLNKSNFVYQSLSDSINVKKINHKILNKIDSDIIKESVFEYVQSSESMVTLNGLIYFINSLNDDYKNILLIDISERYDDNQLSLQVLTYFDRPDLVKKRFDIFGAKDFIEMSALEISPYVHSLYLKEIKNINLKQKGF